MIEVSKEEGWELKVEDGQVVVEEETIELLLKLLNNDACARRSTMKFSTLLPRHP